MSSKSSSISNRLSVEGNLRLARTLHFMACLPPLGLVGITLWLLPQLPKISPKQLSSLELPFLGFCFLSAAPCDTMFYLRLRRFRALPLISERTRIPPLAEAKRGWIACGIAWSLALIYSLLGVIEVFLSRKESAIWPFAIFTAITLYRCRPRHGLFAEHHWGTPSHITSTNSKVSEISDEATSSTSSSNSDQSNKHLAQSEKNEKNEKNRRRKNRKKNKR